MNHLSNHYNPIRGVWCFSYSLSAMALSDWEFMSDDDPWKVSALVSAVVELFLSILLLLGAAIAFFTFRFAKFFGLEPPCTYIGCSHSLHSESLRGQMLRTPPSCKPKDLCRGDFCPHCHPLRIYSKSHSSSASFQEEGSDAFDSSDHNAREQDLDDPNGGYGECHERRCSCSESPWNLRRGAKHTTFIHTASTSNLKKDDNPFSLSRSGSNSSGGFNGRDHSEISQAPADSEEEWAWKGTYVKREKNIDSYVILAHDREALERSGVSEDFNEKSHGMSPSLLERSQEESAEILPLYAVHNEVEELRVSKNDCEHCKQEDDGLVNIAIHLVQGTCFNVSESEKGTRHSRVLMSKDHLEPIDQKVDDDDCLQKGLVAVHSSTLEWGSQEAIVEVLQKASLDGADAPCEKAVRVLEGEQGGLLMQDPDKGVKHVSDDAMAVKDERAFTNALAKCVGSSEHAEELALSGDNEREIITEEKQEEGLDSLKLALQAESSVLAALEAELENERNAAAVATCEAMAMISRLQEEKAAMQIKVAQLQRMSEEKAEYDEQAMGLLKEILYKRETENIALEKEIELYRETLSDELNKRSCLHEEIESSLQSLKPLLLTGGEEVLSPIEDMRHKQGSAFPERGYQSGISSAPWIRQHGPGPDLEELNAFSLNQNVNKRSRDFPMNDMAASMSLRAWDEEGRPRYHVEGDLYGPLYNSEQLKNTGRSVFPMNDEESLSSVLERLWVLEEGLQKLHGKDSAGSQSKAHGAQQLVISSTHRREDKSLTDAWGSQNGCRIESKEQREEVEMDGVAEGFVPIHDVYEVQSSSNRSPPFSEERDPPEGFEGISGNSELPPGGALKRLSRARTAKHRIPISPRFSPAKKLFLSDEAPSTPVFIPPAAGWIVGKSLHPEDVCDPQDLQAQSVGLREERGTTKEGMQQLEVRLKILEEDRELWRESLESFTHRDAELDLLQEIARHLRELRMAGFMNVSGGAFSEDVVTVTSPSKNRPVKKRRYCVGSGQAQMPLLYRRSV